MKNVFHGTWAVLCFLVVAGDVLGADSQKLRRDWDDSMVLIDVKRKQYDYFQPWTTPMQNLQKFGVVKGGREIVTTAEGLSDRTLVRLQKQGRGVWAVGEVSWIDYHANVAVITSHEDWFWKGLDPVKFVDAVSAGGPPMRIIRWRAGKIENRQAEFNQFTVEDDRAGQVPSVQLEVNSELSGAGFGEPLVAADKLVGLVSAQQGNSCHVILGSFIRSVLEGRRKGNYRGFGYFDFVWQPGENPDTLKFLGYTGEPRGVIVIDVPSGGPAEGVLHPRDLLLQVGGFEVDTSGDYTDPEYGRISLENLATRHKWSGDEVRLKVWRAGKAEEVKYRLPKISYESKAVPDQVFDRAPEYLIVGGLVFQPLTAAYLRSWGPDWKRRAPFRLTYYGNQAAKPDRPSLVVLSQVLPDPFNLGYQENAFLTVDTVNGKKISTLSQLRAALGEPKDGFQVITFMPGESTRRIVLNAGEEKQATARVLQRYGIEQAEQLAGAPVR